MWFDLVWYNDVADCYSDSSSICNRRTECGRVWNVGKFDSILFRKTVANLAKILSDKPSQTETTTREKWRWGFCPSIPFALWKLLGGFLGVRVVCPKSRYFLPDRLLGFCWLTVIFQSCFGIFLIFPRWALSETQQMSIIIYYTSLLKIGTPKNREFREILPFSKTCDFLKIGNFEELRRFPKHAIS